MSFMFTSYALFLAMLGLHCYAWAFSSCGERGTSPLRCAGFAKQRLLELRSIATKSTGIRSCSCPSCSCSKLQGSPSFSFENNLTAVHVSEHCTTPQFVFLWFCFCLRFVSDLVSHITLRPPTESPVNQNL